MINEKELRIGNWVISPFKKYKYVQVSMICISGIIGVKPFKISVSFHRKLAPIPLNPEILEKCGFEKCKNGIELICFNECNNIIIASLFTGLPLTLEIDGTRFPLYHIKYLHQLQNLYFALTGKELTVNL